MAQVNNKVVSKVTNPETISQPQANQIPAGKGKSIALEDSFAMQSESHLPEWFDPTSLYVSFGMGYTAYGIDKDGIGSLGDHKDTPLSGKVNAAYTPFVFTIPANRSADIEMGAHLGYQAVAPMRGHEIQAGLSVFVDPWLRYFRSGVSLHYSHLWAKRMECAGSEKGYCEEDFSRFGFNYELDYMINDNLGIGIYYNQALGSNNSIHLNLGAHAVVGF
jgi:hypothetical protein